MSNVMKLKDKLVVTKSNDFIEASYKLTANEQKIILMLASRVQPEDIEFKRYKIQVNEFIDLLGLKRTGAHNDLQEIVKGLMRKVFTIKKETSDLHMPWLASAEYFTGQAYMELEFSPKLKPYLLQLKEHFTTYRLHNVVQLKSVYSIRIYELLKQYAIIGVRVFTLVDLRYTLGIEKDEYKLYGHFKSKVLKVAQKELMEKTDLSFDFEEIKNGRKVAKIRFIIKRRGNALEENNEAPSPIELRLKEFGLNDVQINKIISTYEESYILENLIIVEMEHKKGTVNNLPGYTLTAMEKDFRKQKAPLEIRKEQSELKKKALENEQQMEHELMNQLLDEFAALKKKHREDIEARLSAEEYASLLNEFENGLTDTQKMAYDRELINVEKYMSYHYFNEFLITKFVMVPRDFNTFAREKGYDVIKKDGQYRFAETQ